MYYPAARDARVTEGEGEHNVECEVCSVCLAPWHAVLQHTVYISAACIVVLSPSRISLTSTHCLTQPTHLPPSPIPVNGAEPALKATAASTFATTTTDTTDTTTSTFSSVALVHHLASAAHDMTVETMLSPRQEATPLVSDLEL